MTFLIDIFKFHFKSEQEQVKSNKFRQDMWKSDSIFAIYQVVHYLNDFWNLFLDKVYLKNE